MAATSFPTHRISTSELWIDRENYLLRQAILKLLAIKDSDIRLLILEQCEYAVDNGLHAGGAFSATIPLVALYYCTPRARPYSSRSRTTVTSGGRS